MRDGEAGKNEHAMNPISEDARRRIESLLPWYAAGTLSRSDADRVEQALAGDSLRRALLDAVREAPEPQSSANVQNEL
jgi:hypothetical protein